MSLVLQTPARLALAAATLAAALALTADRADAAFTPAVKDRTLLVTGDATSEKLALRVPPNSPATLEIDVGDNGSADFRVPRAGFDRVRVLAGDGADRVRVDDSGTRAAIAPPTTIEGQGGADTLLGGRGADTLNGGDGEDLVDGNGGSDVAALGAGNDQFVWDAGDGSDSVEGGDGFDTLTFTGSDAAEQVELAADGSSARVVAGAAAIGTGTVERVGVNPLGGDDAVTVGDLEGTAVQELRADLAGESGGTAADAGSDRLILDGTAGDDSVNVISNTSEVFVIGSMFVTARHADPARDELTINGLAGKDRIEAGGAANAFKLVVDGGAGDDNLTGGAGADVLNGGDGDDFVDGRRGDDTIQLGTGDDVFTAQTGDGRDTVEGGAGSDSVRYSGGAANERLAVSAAGPRARLSRDDAVAVDAAGVDRMSLFSFGGSDTITVGDMSGTRLTAVDASLFDFAVPGGAADTVRVDGTGADDRIKVTGSGSVATFTGASAEVTITGVAAAGDRLEVNGLAGADQIESPILATSTIRFLANGGAGDDVLLGGDGDDVLSGGDGADVVFAGRGDNVAFGGAGDDVLRGEEGDDVLDGGIGDDILIGNAGDDVLLNGEVVFDD